MVGIRFAFPCKLRRDEDGRYAVRFRDLPEALTDGANREEALAEAEDCLAAALVGYMAEGRDLPRPSPRGRGAYLVAPAPTIALKAAVYTRARERGVTAAELARALGVDHKEARRILDPRHATKLERLENALAAMGMVTDMVFSDAAAAERVLSAPGYVRPAEIRSKKAVLVKKVS